MTRTKTIRFDHEWEEAPGVSIETHRRTWCRLEIRVDEQLVSDVLDLRANGKRSGVYTTAMPLAEWIVAHWWFLLDEAEVPFVDSGMRQPANASVWAWQRRHNLLTARRGGALPDMSIARAMDGASVVRWCADPVTVPASGMPVRFLASGEAFVDRSELKEELGRFCDAVGARLEGSDDEEARGFVTRWRELRALGEEDRILRSRAAMLGLDGDDPEAIDDATAERLVHGLSELDREAIPDALEASRGPDEALLVASAIGQLQRDVLPEADAGRLRDASRLIASSLRGRVVPPHRIGWEVATRLRLDVLQSTPDVVGRMLDGRLSDSGLLPERIDGVARTLGARQVRGWLGTDTEISRFFVSARPGSTAARFRLAHLLGLGLQGRRSALATDAESHPQKIARAFAAELLAPKEWIEQQIAEPIVTVEQLDDWARTLDVDRRVIEHQVENHRLASIVAD